MDKKIDEIIRILEKADDLFKELDAGGDEARALWSAGIEKLAAAIWVCEHSTRNAEEERSKTNHHAD